GRGWADRRRPFDLGRARLSRHRAGARLALRYEARRLRTGHRRRGARGVPALHQARRHHPRARIVACAGACQRARAAPAEGQSFGGQSVGARRQGRQHRGQGAGSRTVSARGGAGPQGRIARRFAALASAGRAGLVTYLTCGDPDAESFARILAQLPEAGADLIELGMPFSDPMADGPSIQAAGLRALKAGMTLQRTLGIVGDFRARDQATPIVLMGYYNPIYRYGVERFVGDAKRAGVDGLIIVDLPPEHDDELCLPALASGLDFIRLATPTTDDKRLPAVLAHTAGFIYYVSIGITGTKSAEADVVASAVARLRRHS